MKTFFYGSNHINLILFFPIHLVKFRKLEPLTKTCMYHIEKK
jgi:hypothetical protein